MARPAEKVDIGRLCAAMQRARLVLRRPREEQVNSVRQFVGRHWSEEGTSLPVPVNLLSLYIDIVGPKLIASNPRGMLSTENRKLKPIVSAMESWINKQVVKIRLQEVLERAVLNALFSIGIIKVALATPTDSAADAWNVKAGTPFADSVDLDDFVFDIHARDFSQAGFVGHRYRAPLSVVKAMKVYGRDRKDLTASDDQLFNLEGDERISVLGRGTYGDQEEFEDMIDLWEVYLPRHRLVLTLLDNQLTGAAMKEGPSYGKALRIQRWIGPDTGPYHFLRYGTVPGNAMPKAPIQDLVDLHEHLNRTARKLMRQADRQKEVVFVQGGANEDGERLINTNDGEAVRCDNPDKLKQVMWGGPNQANFQLFGAFKDLFSWLAGNLDILGGLSPQSKTLGQDKLLNQNSSATMSKMQDATVNFTESVFTAMCWYWHHDPMHVMQSEFSPPGVPEVSITRKVYPRGAGVGPRGQRRLSRDHDFDDMDIKIDPYSLQHSSPQERLAGLNQIVTQIITPMMQLLQQQGVQFDVNAYLEKVARYMNQPDLAEIITMQEPPPAPPEGGGAGTPQGSPKPPETTRNYNRQSQGNASEFGKDLARMNAMSAGGNGKPQGAGMG